MKLRIIVVTGATMLAACASSPSLRREVESGLRPPVVVASDDLTEFSLEGRRAEYQVPAMSIAIARNGRLSWMGAYGEGVDPTTVFQVASLSKAVSAVGVLKLAAEYGIDLDENIASRFTSVRAEEIAPKGLAITLRGLLSHTAGVVPTDFAGYAQGAALPKNAQLVHGEPPADSKAIVIDPAFKGRFRYCGGGYTLAQVFAEDVSGEPFETLMRRLVFAPVGMGNSSFDRPVADDEGRGLKIALGHREDGAAIEGGWRVYPEMAAAGLWTTAADYLRFLMALLAAYEGHDDGVSPDIVRQMLTVTGDGYGLGVHLDESDATLERVFHGGGNPGYRSYFAMFPERRDAIVIMANSEVAYPFIFEVLRGASEVHGWPGTPVRYVVPVTLPREKLDAYAGVYLTPNREKRVFTLFVEGGELQGRNASDQPFSILPIAEDVFVSPGDGREIRFVPDGDGVSAKIGDRLFPKRIRSP
ncbi:MAG: serine hydrolase domain-containing protein [Myxococcota bacterium]